MRAALESLMVTSDDPESALESKELSRLVQVALDQLHPRYGDALEWKYIHGFSVKEIASFMDITPKAAESVLFSSPRGLPRCFCRTQRRMENRPAPDTRPFVGRTS